MNGWIPGMLGHLNLSAANVIKVQGNTGNICQRVLRQFRFFVKQAETMKCDVYLWQLARRIPKTQETQNEGREMLPKFSVTLPAVSPAVSAILTQWENIFKSNIFAGTFLVLRRMNTRDSGTSKLSATNVIKVRVEKRNICQGILGCFFCGRQSNLNIRNVIQTRGM
jgi:hypothetical protein